jgi:hypothetical protein
MCVDVGCVQRELIRSIRVHQHKLARQMHRDHFQWHGRISIRSQVAPPPIAPSDSCLRLVIVTDKVLGGGYSAVVMMGIDQFLFPIRSRLIVRGKIVGRFEGR